MDSADRVHALATELTSLIAENRSMLNMARVKLASVDWNVALCQVELQRAHATVERLAKFEREFEDRLLVSE